MSDGSFYPQGAVVFQDDDVPFVDGDETFAGVDRQHGKAHAEVRGEDSVPAEGLDLIVIGAGILNAFHKAKIRKPFINFAVVTCRSKGTFIL